MGQHKRKEFFQGLVSVLFYLALVAAGVWLFTSGDPKAWIWHAGVWAPLVFIVLKASTIIFAPLGGNPLYLISYSLFGNERAFVYLLIGDSIGYFGAFFIGRYFGKRLVTRLLSEKQQVWLDGVLGRIGTLKGFCIAHVVLLPYSDVLSYAAGLTSLSTKAFSLVTIPFIVLTILFFLFVGGTFVTSDTRFVAVVALFVLVPLCIVGIRRLIFCDHRTSPFVQKSVSKEDCE